MGNACVYIECPITGMVLAVAVAVAVARKDDPHAWGLPGGKVEEGETERHGALRELQEETGVWLYDGPDGWFPEVFRREGCVIFRGYTTCIHRYGKPAAGEALVAWVTPAQLCAGPFGEYNRRLFAVLGRRVDE